VRDRAPEQRLRAPGRAFDQDVTAGEGGDEQELDRAVLPENDLLDLFLRRLAQLDEVDVRPLNKNCHNPVLPSPLALTCFPADPRTLGEPRRRSLRFTVPRYPRKV